MSKKVIKIRNNFDCMKCSAYCCSYDHIEVRKADVKRLAKHFELSEKAARERFTKVVDDGDRVLRHRNDAAAVAAARADVAALCAKFPAYN